MDQAWRDMLESLWLLGKAQVAFFAAAEAPRLSNVRGCPSQDTPCLPNPPSHGHVALLPVASSAASDPPSLRWLARQPAAHAGLQCNSVQQKDAWLHDGEHVHILFDMLWTWHV